MENSDMERKKRLPTKLGLMIRIGVALYLFYTVYSLKDVFGKYSGGELIFFVAMMAMFLAVGIAICIFSGRDLMQGRYEGGAMDTETVDTQSEDAEAVNEEIMDTETADTQEEPPV